MNNTTRNKNIIIITATSTGKYWKLWQKGRVFVKKKPRIQLYTPRRYSYLCGVHINTVYNWIKRGYLRAIKDEKTIRTYWLIPSNQKKPRIKPGPKPRGAETSGTPGPPAP